MSKKLVFVFIIMALVIIIFNLIGVLGLDFLINDDQVRYLYYTDHDFRWTGKARNFLVPIFQAIFHNILAFSPNLSRFMVLILLMIPTSWLFFILLNKYFNLPIFIAFIISTLVPLLPNQLMYPAFIDGSYVLAALLFYLFSLIYGLKYLNEQSSISIYLVSLLTFIISTMMSEIIIFLTAPMCFLYLFAFNKRKKYLLVLTTCAVSLYKLVESIMNQHSASKITNVAGNKVWNRVISSFEYINPFNIRVEVPFAIIYFSIILLVIIIGIYLSFKMPNYFQSKNSTFNINSKYFAFFVLAFSIIWYLSTSLVFYFVSPYFSSRYFYIPAFGFILLFILSLYIILFKYLPKKNFLISIIFMAILLYSGINKTQNFKSYSSVLNRYSKRFKNELNKYIIPLNSQIVIVGRSAIGTGGYWHWSSGFLRFLLKRDDINGIMHMHYNYYNPFNGIKGRTYKSKMTGINLEYPVLLFENDNSFNQKEFALLWENKKSKNSAWSIYKFNTLTGDASVFATGIGYKKYTGTIDSLKMAGINQEDILFGRIPNKKDSLRLGL